MVNKLKNKRLIFVLIALIIAVFGLMSIIKLKNYYYIKQINEDFYFTSEVKFSYGREKSKEITLKNLQKDVFLYFLIIDRKFSFNEKIEKRDPMYAKTSKYIFEIYYPYNVVGVFEIGENGEKEDFVGNFHLSKNAGINIIEWYFEEIKGVQP